MSQAMKPKRRRIKTSKIVYTTSSYKNPKKDLVDSKLCYIFVQQNSNNAENTRIF